MRRTAVLELGGPVLHSYKSANRPFRLKPEQRMQLVLIAVKALALIVSALCGTVVFSTDLLLYYCLFLHQ